MIFDVQDLFGEVSALFVDLLVCIPTAGIIRPLDSVFLFIMPEDESYRLSTIGISGSIVAYR